MTTLRVPFVWDGVVVASTGSTLDRTYREWCDVEIPDLAEADVVPCLEWRGRGVLGPGGYGLRGGEVTVVAADGRLYEPTLVSRWSQEWRAETLGPADLVEALRPDMGEGQVDPAVVLGMDALRRARTVRLAPPRNLVIEYGSDARERARKSAMALAERHAFVGGVLHAVVPEPRLVASFEDGVPSVGIVAGGDVPYARAMRSYAITELDAAVSHAAELAGMSPTRVALPAFRVLDARPLGLDRSPRETALWAATAAVRTEVGKRVASMPAEAIGTYFDLQDMSGRHGATPDLPSVAEAVRTLALAVAEADPEGAGDRIDWFRVLDRWSPEGNAPRP